MKIKMRVGLSGPAYTLNPGDEHDFPDDEAIRFINAGYAVPVATVPVETTVKQPAPEVRAAAPAAVPVVSSPEPFGGKGDHDGDGKAGGAKPPAKKPAAKGKRR